MANAIFAHGQTNLSAAVTPAIGGGTEDPDFPRANLGDLNPANPFKFTTNTGALVWDFGAPQDVALVALIHHNLSAGLQVRFQGNAIDSWGSPSLNFLFSIGAAAIDGYRPNAWGDLTAFGVYSYRFWRLVVVDANAAPITIGDLWFNAARQTFVHNYAWNYHEAEDRPARRALETRGGVRFTYPGVGRRRRLTATVQSSAAGRNGLRDWHRSTYGGDRPSLFIPDPDAAIGEAWLGYSLLPAFDAAHAFTNDVSMPFEFIECAYGGAW